MSSQAVAEVLREHEFMRTADAVNRFVVSTVQFLNRFAAQCDCRLLETSRSLQRLEVLTVLLEAKLKSVDNEFEEEEEEEQVVKHHKEVDARGFSSLAAVSRDVPPPMPGLLRTASSHRQPPPPPPSGQQRPNWPPLPPGATLAKRADTVTTAPPALLPPPPPPPFVMPGQPSAGFVPPPPPSMPLLGGFTMSTHPRLQGYFHMLALRVPVSAIREKMQADGHEPEWLDTPNAPAPPALSSTKNLQYESD